MNLREVVCIRVLSDLPYELRGNDRLTYQDKNDCMPPPSVDDRWGLTCGLSCLGVMVGDG